MHAARRFWILSLVAPLTLLGLSAGPAAAQTPIGPNQHFVGLVNGSNDHPVVYTICPGPVGQTGQVAGGQTFSVAEVANGPGFTGLFSAIYAWFVPTSVTPPPPTMVKFAKYGVAKRIPTSIRVPCSGQGQVEFSSCPYLAPCAAGWVPDYVTVTFENIAV